MDKVSVIITEIAGPRFPLSYEFAKMTAECVESYERTKNIEDEIVVITDYERRGNAWSWNEGIRRAKHDIILISDNDITAVRWREEMLAALSDNIVFPTVFNEKIGQNQSHVAGECWMLKRSTWGILGAIDETYGSYFEDTDYFQRAKTRGIKLKLSTALVSHKSQGTFRKMYSQEYIQGLFVRNKAIYEGRYGACYPFVV